MTGILGMTRWELEARQRHVESFGYKSGILSEREGELEKMVDYIKSVGTIEGICFLAEKFEQQRGLCANQLHLKGKLIYDVLEAPEPKADIKPPVNKPE